MVQPEAPRAWSREVCCDRKSRQLLRLPLHLVFFLASHILSYILH